MSRYTVLLDANILYPAPLRDVFVQIALSDLFKAKWSADIHREWIEALLIQQPHRERAALERTRDLMDRATRDCLVTGYEPLIPSLDLPDPDDRHVLAAAIVGQCDAIVTHNLKDFPVDRLASFGIDALHPDDFLSAQLSLAPGVICSAIRKVRPALSIRPSVSTDTSIFWPNKDLWRPSLSLSNILTFYERRACYLPSVPAVSAYARQSKRSLIMPTCPGARALQGASPRACGPPSLQSGSAPAYPPRLLFGTEIATAVSHNPNERTETMTTLLATEDNYKTQCAKGRDGWEATSEAVIGQTPEGDRILKLRTSKTYGGVDSFATVCIRKDCNVSGFVSETHALFSDFAKHRVAMANRRATEKAVREVHAQALRQMETLITEATAFYEAKDAEAA